MRFEFDSTKAASNVRKHGVSFADTEALFEDPLAVHAPDPDAEGEERFIAMRLGGAGEVLVVVYLLRGTAIRLISARRASKREVKAYAS